MNGEPQPSFNERINGNVNFVLLFCSALSLPSVVFLHRDIGSKFIGPRVLLSILFILFAPSFWPHGDPRPVMLFLVVFVLMCCFSKSNARRRRARGEPIHRFYDGYPRLLRFLPKRGEAAFKKFEPFIVFLVAMLLMPISEALGGFLIFSAIGLAASVTSTNSAINERLEAMRDQQIENQYLIERFREVGRK